MSQAILSGLASDVIQTTSITGDHYIHALFHGLFYPSFLYNHTNPRVNFINRSAAIRLCDVLYALCSTVSSTSAPTSHAIHSVSIIKTLSLPRASVSHRMRKGVTMDVMATRT